MKAMTLATLLVLSVCPMPTSAGQGPPAAQGTQTGQAADVAPPGQRRAFALGYALRAAEDSPTALLDAVKKLKDMDDDKLAGMDVSRLSRDVPDSRQRQQAAYHALALLLAGMGAPTTLRDWAAGTAAGLTAPPAFSREEAALAKTEPDTALLLARLDEVRAVRATTEARKPLLSAWLKLSGGGIALWTADTGRYAYDLYMDTAAYGNSSRTVSGARLLLARAPLDSPAGVREALAALVPRGGNLQNLATVPAEGLNAEQRASSLGLILGTYNADPLSKKLDAPR